MGSNVPIIIFQIAVSVCSVLCFLYNFTSIRDIFLCQLEFVVLPGAAIYYAYLAINNIMGRTTTTTTVIDGWFRYTLYFAFSAKFLFCLVTCIFVTFIQEIFANNFTIPKRNNSTENTLCLIFTYGLLPIATLINCIYFVQRMKCTHRNDITAILFLSLFWFIYMIIMICVVQKFDFGVSMKISIAYTFIRIFLVISGLPVHDYFFLYGTKGSGNVLL